jgi:hypothetical protein
MGALTALQMLYPDFNSSMQANFRAMLTIGWQGLVNSSLYNNNQFRMMDTYGDDAYGDDASFLGLMTLFLYGIIPDTGYLAMNASNERYQDYRTCFPTSQWSFNYQNQTIRIPVIAGNLSFLFGSEEVSQNFPSNGVYNIQFADDWNSIISITNVTDISTTTLQPVTLQAIPRSTPSPTPTPTLTLGPSLTPFNTQISQTQTRLSNKTSTANPDDNSTMITVSPSPTPTQQDTPTQKPSDTPMQAYVIVFIMSAAFGSATALYYVKRKNRQVGTLGNKNLRTFICRNKKRL